MTAPGRGLQRPKHKVLELLQRTGYPPETLDHYERVLPDPVVLERDAHLFAARGISREVLMDLLGGSP